MTDTAPPLKPPLSDPASFHPRTLEAIQTCQLPAISKMGTRFFEPPNRRLLCPRMLELIAHQRQYVSFNHLCVLGSLDPTDDDAEAAAYMQMSVEHELLSLPFEDRQLTLLPYRDAIRIALFVFGQPICTVIKPTSAFARSLSGQLMRRLESAGCTLRRPGNRDLSIWLLFILAFISYEQEDCVWAVGILAELVAEHQLQTVEQFELLLCGFFYIDMWFRNTVTKVWEDVQILRNETEVLLRQQPVNAECESAIYQIQ